MRLFLNRLTRRLGMIPWETRSPALHEPLSSQLCAIVRAHASITYSLRRCRINLPRANELVSSTATSTSLRLSIYARHIHYAGYHVAADIQLETQMHSASIAFLDRSRSYRRGLLSMWGLCDRLSILIIIELKRERARLTIQHEISIGERSVTVKAEFFYPTPEFIKGKASYKKIKERLEKLYEATACVYAYDTPRADSKNKIKHQRLY